MIENYIAAWLADQIDDSPEKFPTEYDFNSIVDQLDFYFDHEVITDHLEGLLSSLLNPKCLD